MAVDPYASMQRTLDGPADHLATIVPNDAADLQYATRAIFVTGAGTIKVDLVGGIDGYTTPVLPAGFVLSARVLRVYATGTTATGLMAMW